MISLIRVGDRSFFRNDLAPLPPRYYWTAVLLPATAPSGAKWIKPVFLGGSLNVGTGEITGTTWTESATSADRPAMVSDMEALQISVDEELATKANVPSPWVTFPTLQTGFTAGTTAPMYRINNGKVEFKGKLIIAALLAIGATRQVCTMPTGARPALTTTGETARIPHVINNNAIIATVSVNNAGIMVVGSADGYAANDIIDLTGLSYAIT